jgi:hypothetical protein
MSLTTLDNRASHKRPLIASTHEMYNMHCEPAKKTCEGTQHFHVATLEERRRRVTNIVNNTSATRNTTLANIFTAQHLSPNTTTTYTRYLSSTPTKLLHTTTTTDLDSLATQSPYQAPHRTSNNRKNTNVLHPPLQMPDMHAHPAHPVRAVQSRAAAQFRSRGVSEPDEEAAVQ